MKQIYTYLRTALCLLALTFATLSANAAEKTIEFTYESTNSLLTTGTSSYGADIKDIEIDNFTFSFKRVLRVTASKSLQFAGTGSTSGSGGMYNKTQIPGLKKIVIYKTESSGKFSVYAFNKPMLQTETEPIKTEGKGYVSIEGQPVEGNESGIETTTYAVDGLEYFLITVETSNVPKAAKIEIVYDDNAGETTDPEHDAVLTFPQTNYTATLGETFTSPTLNNPYLLDVTYTSSDESVAKVDSKTGSVELIAAGTTTITATSPKTDDYKAGEASYTLTVVNSFDASGYKALVAEKNGTYYISKNTVEQSGSVTISEAVPLSYVINRKVVNFADKENYSWKIKTEGNTATVQNPQGEYLSISTSDKTNVLLSSEKVDLYTPDGRTFYGKEGGRYFGLYAALTRFASYNGASYPAAEVMDFADGYVRGITFGEDETFKVGTICLPNAVAADDVRGAKFYEIAGQTTDALVLSEVTGGLEAGMPYIFIADAEEIVAAYTGDDAVTTPQSKNGLHGTLDQGVTVADGCYVINSNMLRPSNGNATVGANRAWVNLEEVEELGTGAMPANSLLLGFDGTLTGIAAARQDAATTGAVYDLGGRRVAKPASRGLYIADGKKVLVK